MFGSVVIRKQQNKNPHRLKSLERFDILYTHDFNPNSSDLIMFRENVEKEYLGAYLVSLCKMFYEKTSSTNILERHVSNHKTQQTIQTVVSKIIYQCTHCYTVYDERLGDAENNIAAGTSFEELPPSYCCPLCEATKEDFAAVEENKLKMQPE